MFFYAYCLDGSASEACFSHILHELNGYVLVVVLLWTFRDWLKTVPRLGGGECLGCAELGSFINTWGP